MGVAGAYLRDRRWSMLYDQALLELRARRFAPWGEAVEPTKEEVYWLMTWWEVRQAIEEGER